MCPRAITVRCWLVPGGVGADEVPGRQLHCPVPHPPRGPGNTGAVGQPVWAHIVRASTATQ